MKRWLVGILLVLVLLLAGSHAVMTDALTLSQSGDVPVTAIVPGPPPTTPAVITSPSTNTHVQTTPLVVSGTCGPGLMVRVFDNSQLAGSVACEPDGTFVMNITLDMGTNALTALNYDTLDQPGPTSPTVTVIVDTPKNPELTKLNSGTKTKTANSIEQLQSGSKQTLLQSTVIGTIFWFIDFGVKVNPWVNRLINVFTLILVILLLVYFVRRKRRIDKSTSV